MIDTPYFLTLEESNSFSWTVIKLLDLVILITITLINVIITLIINYSFINNLFIHIKRSETGVSYLEIQTKIVDTITTTICSFTHGCIFLRVSLTSVLRILVKKSIKKAFF